MKKFVPMVVYGLIGVAGLMSFYTLLTSANYGLAVAAIPTWALAFLLTSVGFTKAVGFDIVQAISVA